MSRTNAETRKILFVAHSLGGLVTAHALSHSWNDIIPTIILEGAGSIVKLFRYLLVSGELT